MSVAMWLLKQCHITENETPSELMIEPFFTPRSKRYAPLIRPLPIVMAELACPESALPFRYH